MSVDVVVPTFRRPEARQRCEDALNGQTVKPASVTFIDDSETDNGPGWARNRGWRQGSADIVAFTDDDCVPALDWVEKIQAAFDHGAAVLEGSITTANGTMDAAPYIQYDRFKTANMAYRRELLESLNGFDEGYYIAREDTDLAWRAMQRGHSVVWAPDVVVHHPDRQGAWRVRSDSEQRLYALSPKWYAECIATNMHRGALKEKRVQTLFRALRDPKGPTPVAAGAAACLARTGFADCYWMEAGGQHVRQPNLFIIGAPRSGTTSLYHALKQHPEIFLSDVKEPWYYALRDEKESSAKFRMVGVRDESTYNALFADAGDQTYVGEASTLYLSSAAACKSIAKLGKDTRAIAILREPVARSFSNFMQHVRDQRETTEDFAEALEAAPERMAAGWSDFYDYLRLSTYAADVKRYQRALGKRFLVLRYDDLKADADATVARIFEWLGLDALPVQTGQYNASGKRKRSGMAWRILRGTGPLKRVAKAFIPRRAQTRIWLWLHKRSLQQVTLDAALAQRLHTQFQQDIEETAKATGLNLTDWTKDAS